MIDASQRMVTINAQGGEAKDGEGMNPVMKRHLELEIKTLQNASRDVNKLERLLKVKGKACKRLCRSMILTIQTRRKRQSVYVLGIIEDGFQASRSIFF